MGHPKGDVAALCRSCLRAGDVAIDVGVAHGEVSRAMLAAGATVYGMEPDPRGQKTLDELRGAQFIPLRIAAGPRIGARPFYQAPKIEQSSLIQACARIADKKGAAPITEVMVPILPLDAVTLRPVALVKIDAQGAEEEILLGAPWLLKTCPTWVLEIWPHGLTCAQSSAGAVLDRLRDAGLSLFWADQQPIDRAEFDAWVGATQVCHHVNIIARRV